MSLEKLRTAKNKQEFLMAIIIIEHRCSTCQARFVTLLTHELSVGKTILAWGGDMQDTRSAEPTIRRSRLLSDPS